MLVHSSITRHVTIGAFDPPPPKHVADDAAARKQWAETYAPLRHPEVVLVTGVNEVPTAVWLRVERQAKDHPVLRHYLDGGEITPKHYESLADVKDDKEAVALVREVYSLDMLDRWSGGEKRKAVKEAIRVQRDMIQGLIDKATAEPERKKP